MSKKFTLLLALFALVGLLVACQPAATPTQAPTPVPPTAPPIVSTVPPQPPAPTTAPEGEELTLAIEHFSVIEGTTWSGAHDRAGKRLAEKYPNVKYVYQEAVGPDLSVPSAEEMIADGADIVVGNAEFMGLPLKDIADKYPDVYFVAIIASDLSTKPNFLRVFPRHELGPDARVGAHDERERFGMGGEDRPQRREGALPRERPTAGHRVELDVGPEDRQIDAPLAEGRDVEDRAR